MCVDDSGNGVGSVVKPVDELEAEGDEQSESEWQIGQRGRQAHRLRIVDEVRRAIRDARGDRKEKYDQTDSAARRGDRRVRVGKLRDAGFSGVGAKGPCCLAGMSI